MGDRIKATPGWVWLLIALALMAIVVQLFTGGQRQQSMRQVEDWKVMGSQGRMRFVLVPEEQQGSTTLYRQAIDTLCRRGEWCGLLFWSDPAMIPSGLPMSRAEADAQVASYIYNPHTAFEELAIHRD